MLGIGQVGQTNTLGEKGDDQANEPVFYNVMPLAKSGSPSSGQTVPAVSLPTSPVIKTTNTEQTVAEPDMLKETKEEKSMGTSPASRELSQENTAEAPKVNVPILKKYTPPSKAAFSNLINPDKMAKKEKMRNLMKNLSKGLVGFLAIAIVGVAVWYTAVSFGGSLGLPALADWLRGLPFINKTEPNTAASAGKDEGSGSKIISVPENDDVEGDTKLTTPEWRLKYFEISQCGPGSDCHDTADPDQDGLFNEQEFKQGTDPKNPDSDQDGLADGDEVSIFGCSPLDPRTAGNLDYSDADDVRGGWKCSRKPGEDEFYSQEDLLRISATAKLKGFHEPTLSSIGSDAQWYLDWGKSDVEPLVQGASTPEGFDSSEESKLERDIERLNTIKKIGIALVKYQQEIGSFPDTNSFPVMVASVRPYLGVATNPFDPINFSPFEYKYSVSEENTEFTLQYYSETQTQEIKYASSSAKKDYLGELAIERDEQRMYDLDKLRSALLIVSAAESSVRDGFYFPSQDTFESKIVPQYLPKMPVDPITGKVFEYQVSKDRTTFTLKAVLEKVPAGQTGYLCNQEECRMY